MRTFNEFVQSKEYAPLAEALVRSGVNVDRFCERFLTLAEETDWSDEQSINELWRGLGGLFGAGSSAVKQAGQAVGSAADRAISSVGQAGIQAGKAVGGAAMGAGRAIGQAGMQAGQAAGSAAMGAGRAVGGALQAGANAVTDIYQSAEHQGKVRDTMGKLANMKAELQKVGIQGTEVEGAFEKFQNDLTAALNKLASDRTQRVGPQGVHDARPKLGIA